MKFIKNLFAAVSAAQIRACAFVATCVALATTAFADVGGVSLSPGASLDADAISISTGVSDTLSWGRKIFMYVGIFLLVIGIFLFFWRRSKRNG